MHNKLYYNDYNFFVKCFPNFFRRSSCIFFTVPVCYGGRAFARPKECLMLNSRQLQYAVLLSQTRNFSQAADSLGISQPALSKHIMNLENELGVKLFDRSTAPLSLTPAGEHFIRSAQDLLNREDTLLKSMAEYRTGDAGQLTIGVSPFRSLYMMPELVKKVSDKFPAVRICLQEAGSDALRAGAAEGKYDFAVVNLPVDEAVLDVIPLEKDALVLAVPDSLLPLLPAHCTPDKAIDLKDCAALPFIVVGPTQEMRILFDKLCTRAGLMPRIALEVVGLTTAWAMAHSGTGATLLPLQFISSGSFREGMTLFPVKDEIYVRQPVIVTRRDQYLSPAARYAMDTLINQNAHK